jgi:hypothetical protein
MYVPTYLPMSTYAYDLWNGDDTLGTIPFISLTFGLQRAR